MHALLGAETSAPEVRARGAPRALACVITRGGAQLQIQSAMVAYVNRESNRTLYCVLSVSSQDRERAHVWCDRLTAPGGKYEGRWTTSKCMQPKDHHQCTDFWCLIFMTNNCMGAPAAATAAVSGGSDCRGRARPPGVDSAEHRRAAQHAQSVAEINTDRRTLSCWRLLACAACCARHGP